MDEKKVLCNAIASFIEKYWEDASRFKKPKCVFNIEGVGPVQIEEQSLNKRSDNLYTFMGSACVSMNDYKSQVTFKKNFSIVGNATVAFYPNGIGSNEKLPDITEVEITKAMCVVEHGN